MKNVVGKEMSLVDHVDHELKLLAQSRSVPAVLRATDASGIVLTVNVTAIDSMSLEFTQLELFVPQLQSSKFDMLQQWAEQLSQRITYLLENIGPLEFDPASGQVMIRSTPPGLLPDGSQFYEIMLSSAGSGTFTLRRYRSIIGTPGRDQVEMQLTFEVLLRLVTDLIATIP